MLNRKAADLVDRETTTGLGQYSLRLPSYRSSYARRYHPYPAVRRRARNDEPYMVRPVGTSYGNVLTTLWLRRICYRTGLLTSTLRPPSTSWSYPQVCNWCVHFLSPWPARFTRTHICQQRPIQGDHSDDDDVTMFALDEGTSKQARKKQGREVTHPEEEKAWDDNTAEAITRPPARLTLVSSTSHLYACS